MGRRDTGQNGDSGVGARMFGRILEEMSNSANRGRIFRCSYKPCGYSDDALLRRFDAAVPCSFPDVDEACHLRHYVEDHYKAKWWKHQSCLWG